MSDTPNLPKDTEQEEKNATSLKPAEQMDQQEGSLHPGATGGHGLAENIEPTPPEDEFAEESDHSA